MKKTSNIKKVCTGVISSGYGRRTHPITKELGSFHYGVDIACAIGTPILAPVTTVIMAVFFHELGGNTVILKDLANNDRYGFCHLKEALFPIGTVIEKGSIFARSGNSGHSSGPHLHFTYAAGGTWLQNVCVKYKFQNPTSKIDIK